jgi:hypothetical protein
MFIISFIFAYPRGKLNLNFRLAAYAGEQRKE